MSSFWNAVADKIIIQVEYVRRIHSAGDTVLYSPLQGDTAYELLLYLDVELSVYSGKDLSLILEYD